MTTRIATAVAPIALCAGLTPGAEKKVIFPNGAEPNVRWSFGILTDVTLYVSVTAGIDPAGKIPTTLQVEVKRSLNNVNAALKEAWIRPF